VPEALRNRFYNAARVARAQQQNVERRRRVGLGSCGAKHGAVQLLDVKSGAEAPKVVHADGIHGNYQIKKSFFFLGCNTILLVLVLVPTSTYY
jgi:hypothetical protein